MYAVPFVCVPVLLAPLGALNTNVESSTWWSRSVMRSVRDGKRKESFSPRPEPAAAAAELPAVERLPDSKRRSTVL